MNLSDIRQIWKEKVTDNGANVAAWDELAKSFYSNHPLPNWDTDAFLKQLLSEVEFSKHMSVLDIGCGTGAYSIALAEKAGKVVGVDLSPKMLEYAKMNVKEHKIENISLICGDFNEVLIEGKFDLVFAHMTPAVADAATFEKMLSYASKYCYLVKPVHRTDSVFGKLREIAGIRSRRESFDDGILYAFAMLWKMHKLPTIRYHADVWHMEKNLDEARAWYLNKLKAHNEIDNKTEENILKYLNDISVGGIVYETTNTTIVTMGWRMDE
ncbi:MAG: class I SAM-dependent methyltransferase [Eubacteriales bacterium]